MIWCLLILRALTGTDAVERTEIDQYVDERVLVSNGLAIAGFRALDA